MAGPSGTGAKRRHLDRLGFALLQKLLSAVMPEVRANRSISRPYHHVEAAQTAIGISNIRVLVKKIAEAVMAMARVCTTPLPSEEPLEVPPPEAVWSPRKYDLRRHVAAH